MPAMRLRLWASIKLNCNFAAVNGGVDRNWIVATIEEAPHDHDCPNETVGKKKKSSISLS